MMKDYYPKNNEEINRVQSRKLIDLADESHP